MSSGVEVIDLRGGTTTTEPERGRSLRNSLKKRRPTVEIRRRRSDDTVPLAQHPVPVSILQRPGNTYAYTGAGGPSTPRQPPSQAQPQYQQQPQQQQAQPRPREQIIYIATGHPLIIVDERRNPNTPLPTVIRDGKVIVGDAHGIEHIQAGNRTVVRSEHSTSVYQEGDTVIRVPTPQSVSHHQDAPHTDSKLKKSRTWGHSRPRDPPFLHPPRRTRSNSHGMRDIWLGWLTGARDRMERGRIEREEAKRERKLERENRERDFRNNLHMFKNGRKDAPLVY